ncbi:PREDICTED: pleckstrin homology-like domain family A member 1, partial [Phaethon lepturus]|uniref:pleckstrin homology-like domain family A member 1 n=1 Tax=Phaethon lepturus TaxID=97097 RepID=UPI00053058DD
MVKWKSVRKEVPQPRRAMEILPSVQCQPQPRAQPYLEPQLQLQPQTQPQSKPQPQ